MLHRYFYVIYDTYNNDIAIATFNTGKEVAEYFNMAETSIYINLNRKHKIKFRYEIKKYERKDFDD